MRKLFTFLFAALMSVGMWADPNIVTPTISGDLSFTESTTVTMECTSPNSDIYYTTDDVTDPRCDCAAAPEYTHPITITETTIIKAAAYDGNDWSAVAEVTFTKVPASEPTTTVVTITDSDFPASESSFTKDGVTVSAQMIDGMQGNITGPGSFSTTLGNFTKIEVSAASISVSGEGWSGDSERQTWTGNASSVSFIGDINGYEEGTTLKFTIVPAGEEGIENIVLTEKAKKVVVDGMVYIVRDGKLFNLTGAEVK